MKSHWRSRRYLFSILKGRGCSDSAVITLSSYQICLGPKVLSSFECRYQGEPHGTTVTYSHCFHIQGVPIQIPDSRFDVLRRMNRVPRYFGKWKAKDRWVTLYRL